MSNLSQKELLELLLTAQVLNLANHLKSKHGASTDDFTKEAIREIKKKQPKILALLAESSDSP